MKTLEELKKEAELAQQKLAVVEAAAREKAREAELEREKAQRIARRDEERKGNIIHAEKIVNELVKAGYPKATWEFDEDSMASFPRILEDGEHEDSIKFDTIDGSWTGRASKTMVTVGGYPTLLRRFPLKADGAFNYEKIVAEYVIFVEARKAQREEKQKEAILWDTNSKLREQVCKATGISDFSGIVAPGEYDLNTVTLNIRITLDGDSAIKFINAVKEIGIKLS